MGLHLKSPDPEKTQYRAKTGLFFPPVRLKISGSPQGGSPAVSETKIGAMAVSGLWGRPAPSDFS